MAQNAPNLAKHKNKMLSMLAKFEPTSGRAGAFRYDQAKTIVNPAAFRPKPVDPVQRLIRWVQAALMTVLGVKLPLDGTMNQATRAALLKFQKLAGLPQTGVIDSSTLSQLEKIVDLPAPRAAQTPPPPWLDQPVAPVKPLKPKGSDKDKGAHSADALPSADTADAVQVGHSFEGRTGHHHDGQADAHQLWAAKAPASSAERLQTLVMDRFLQREALQGVMTLAFARDWIHQELDRTGRKGDSALLAEMLAWWERAQAPEREVPPSWLVQVAALAQHDMAKAADQVRAAWRQEMGEKA